MLEGLDQRRHRDLAYERQKTMLEDAKLESQRTRERESRIPEVTKGITDILEDKETDPFQKEELLSRYALRYPHMASKGVTGVLFTAANAAVGAQGRGIAYRQGKEDRMRAKVAAWVARGIPEATALVVAQDGKVTLDDTDSINLTSMIKQQALDKAKAISEAARNKAELSKAVEDLADGYKFRQGLKFEDDDEFMTSILDGGKAPADKENNLTKDSRESLIARLSQISRHPRSKFTKFKDAELLEEIDKYLGKQQETLQHATGSSPRPSSKAYTGFGQ